MQCSRKARIVFVYYGIRNSNDRPIAFLMHVPQSYLRKKWVDKLYWAETVLTKAFGAKVTKADSHMLMSGLPMYVASIFT